MKVLNKPFQIRMMLFICAVALSNLAQGVAPAPFQYVRTIQMSGETRFGQSLADFQGNLLVGAANQTYRYSIQSNTFVQSYDHAAGTYFGGNWLAGFGNKIAIGSDSTTGSVQLFDSATGQLLQTFNGAETGDRFGWSLASNGSTLFVGAPELRNGSTYYGQGKVVAIDSLNNRRTILNPEPTPQPSSEESFGYDIGVIGNDLYVGALYDSNGGKVWRIAADTGAVLARYDNPHGTLGNGGRPQFGNSLDVLGNFLLVGANQSSAAGATASGAAYLFDRTNGNLLQTFFDPVPGVLDNFGIDVALMGDFALIGAHSDDDGHSGGAVFVFDVHTGQHLQTIESPSASSQFFGLEVQRVGQNYLAISETTGNGSVHIYSIVPEPGSLALTTVGLMGLGFLRRKRVNAIIHQKQLCKKQKHISIQRLKMIAVIVALTTMISASSRNATAQGHGGGEVYTINGVVSDAYIADSIDPPFLPTTLRVLAPAEISHLFVRQRSVVEMSGGTVGYFRAVEESRVTISGGSVDNLDLVHSSLGEVFAGDIASISADDNAVANVYGGTHGSFTATDHAHTNIYGGSFAHVAVLNTDPNGPSPPNLSIHGGTIATAFTVGGTVNIHGGTITDFMGFNPGVINVYGGSITHFQLANNHTAIYGTDLLLTPVSSSETESKYILTGLLQDGSPLNSTVLLHTGAVFELITVPEPGTFLLAIVGLIGCCLLSRRRVSGS